MSSPSAPVIAGVSKDQPTVVAYALQEASRLETSLRVVHCYLAHAGDVYVGTDSHETMRAAGVAVLQQARAVVEASPLTVPVDYVLERGTAGPILVEHADDASALVVGADDVNWLARMLGGEVSGLLALTAACPVTVVPRQLSSAESVDGVVVTLDGDTSAPGPLRYGFEQADFRAEDLHVLHATPVATTVEDTALLTARVRQEVARWNAITPQVSSRLSLTNGDALDECFRATAGASLLVIGRPHGHAHLFALTRPVAMLVLREARCAVAIVPAQYGALHRPAVA